MYSIELFAAEATMANHTRRADRSAQQRRLLRQIAERRPGWVSQQRGRLAHWLGYHLVTLGEWLEAVGRPQPSF
jgi:hypothetical protein